MRSCTPVVSLALLFVANAAVGQTVITGATIIDGTGAAPIPNGVVVINQDRIVAVGPRDRVSIPRGAREIRAAGKYLIPGLMDANVHLYYWVNSSNAIKYEGRYEEIILDAAQTALKAGVTSVFDTYGPRQALVNVRERIDFGEAIGSRIFLAGNIIGLDGIISGDFSTPKDAVCPDTAVVNRINELFTQGTSHDLVWRSADEVATAVRGYIARGDLDFVKYASSSHTPSEFINFSPETQKGIVAEAHRARLTVQAHVTTPESIRMAMDAGVDILTHCDISGRYPTPQLLIDRIAREKFACSTLFQPARTSTRAGTQAVNGRNLIKAGATLLLSTDGGTPWPAQRVAAMRRGAGTESLVDLSVGAYLWLEGAIEMGMQPMDALLAATRNIAIAYKQPDLGTLEAGKKADLVILDADPLASPRNYRAISMVMQNGRVIDRHTIPNVAMVKEAIAEAQAAPQNAGRGGGGGGGGGRGAGGRGTCPPTPR